MRLKAELRTARLLRNPHCLTEYRTEVLHMRHPKTIDRPKVRAQIPREIPETKV
jgi:hypothetical protein